MLTAAAFFFEDDTYPRSHKPFVKFRFNSWIVISLPENKIHEPTINDTKNFTVRLHLVHQLIDQPDWQTYDIEIVALDLFDE